jgi:hypothetical protein
VSISNVIVRQNSSVAVAASCLSLDDVDSRTALYYRVRALSTGATFAFGERTYGLEMPLVVQRTA